MSHPFGPSGKWAHIRHLLNGQPGTAYQRLMNDMSLRYFTAMGYQGNSQGFHISISSLHTQVRVVIGNGEYAIPTYQVSIAPGIERVQQENDATGRYIITLDQHTVVYDIQRTGAKDRVTIEITKGVAGSVNLVINLPQGSGWHYCNGEAVTVMSRDMLDHFLRGTSATVPSSPKDTMSGTQPEIHNHPYVDVYQNPVNVPAYPYGRRPLRSLVGKPFCANTPLPTDDPPATTAAGGQIRDRQPRDINDGDLDNYFNFGVTTGDIEGVGTKSLNNGGATDNFFNEATSGINSTAEVGNAAFGEGLFQAGTPTDEKRFKIDLGKAVVTGPEQSDSGDDAFRINDDGLVVMQDRPDSNNADVVVVQVDQPIDLNDNTCGGVGDVLLFAQGNEPGISSGITLEPGEMVINESVLGSDGNNAEVEVVTQPGWVQQTDTGNMTNVEVPNGQGADEDDVLTSTVEPEDDQPAVPLMTAQEAQLAEARGIVARADLFPPGSLTPDTKPPESDDKQQP